MSINNYEIASKEARKASKSFLWDEIATKNLIFYNTYD
jgi:hypothetical protein